MSLLAAARVGAAIDQVQVSAHTIPTEEPESDGTLEWASTTIVIVRLEAAGETGLGYTYGPAAIAELIRSELAPVLTGHDALDVRARYADTTRRLRNAGRPGMGMMAVSAIDVALWDLKARILGTSLVSLLGGGREAVPVYGSGGFTSYSPARTARQFEGWANLGIRSFKMKVGRDPDADLHRVRQARAAIGATAELFVDANGAYDAKQALRFAERFAEEAVVWFEEPVSSENREALRLIRERSPAGMEITAGEYASTLPDFRLLLEGSAVDVVMPDATRCGGVTGFLDAAALARAFQIPLSAHTAPALHLHVCAAVPEVRHLEYFHDHARIEAMLFEGGARPIDGALRPDPERPGHGLELRTDVAAEYAV